MMQNSVYCVTFSFDINESILFFSPVEISTLRIIQYNASETL